jgi:chemotaxis protein CheC
VPINDEIHEAITDEEMDILQEVMNIAFGSAAADLAEVIDIYAVLSVPTIKVMQTVDLPKYIRSAVKEYDKLSIVEQNFIAKFRGIAILIFPSGIGRALIAMLDKDSESTLESDPIEALELETLMEVGNILVGACVSKVAELLGDVVIYAPPRVIVENLAQDAISKDLFDPDKLAIILQTVFQFDGEDISGLLFLICSNESIGWLKKALHEFVKQFE